MKTEEEIAKMLDEEIAKASTWLRSKVQPYLLGSPEQIYGMSIALQRLGVEIVMSMAPDGCNAFDEGMASLEALRKEVQGMKDSGYPAPPRAIVVDGRKLFDPTSKA